MIDTFKVLKMDEKALRRLVAKQQVEMAQSDLNWAGSGHPDDYPLYEEALAEAKRVKREVYKETR